MPIYRVMEKHFHVAPWDQQLSCLFLCLSILHHSILPILKVWVGQCNVWFDGMTINYLQLVKGVSQGVILWLEQGESPEWNSHDGWKGRALPTLHVYTYISGHGTASPASIAHNPKHLIYQPPKTWLICSQKNWMGEARTNCCLHAMLLTLEINSDGISRYVWMCLWTHLTFPLCAFSNLTPSIRSWWIEVCSLNL